MKKSFLTKPFNLMPKTGDVSAGLATVAVVVVDEAGVLAEAVASPCAITIGLPKRVSPMNSKAVVNFFIGSMFWKRFLDYFVIFL
jgi:hypothetical protein